MAIKQSCYLLISKVSIPYSFFILYFPAGVRRGSIRAPFLNLMKKHICMYVFPLCPMRSLLTYPLSSQYLSLGDFSLYGKMDEHPWQGLPSDGTEPTVRYFLPREIGQAPSFLESQWRLKFLGTLLITESYFICCSEWFFCLKWFYYPGFWLFHCASLLQFFFRKLPMNAIFLEWWGIKYIQNKTNNLVR